MPQNLLRIRKEMRMLGAMQIMNGLLLYQLGLLWRHLLVTQSISFGKTYIPLASLLGYPFWGTFFFTLSGVFAVMAEKRRSKLLVSYTMVVNIINICVAVIGVGIISLEILLFTVLEDSPVWSQKAAKILSEDMLLFTLLQLILACTVTYWARQAKRRQ